jgi:hypothetical protein
MNLKLGAITGENDPRVRFEIPTKILEGSPTTPPVFSRPYRF